MGPSSAGWTPKPATSPTFGGRSNRHSASRRPARYRLSDGSRYPRYFADYVELIVARLIGRNLGRWEGCLVQVVAVLVLGFLIWAAFASGLVFRITDLFAHWYASQLHFGISPKPS
jgi:hypothetical protein